jgi:hypothetical protein
MNGQDIFCLIMILVPIIWIGISVLARKGKLVGLVDRQLKAAPPARREYILDLRRSYGMITDYQYTSLRVKYGLDEQKPQPGPISPVALMLLNDDQIKTAQTMATVSAAFPFKQRIKHFNHLYTLCLQLLKEVNLYRKEKGIGLLEIKL